MSVTRQTNWLGQQRVDIPHLRALESSIANDFDLSIGTVTAGRYPLIVKGFNITTLSMVGKPASSLVLNTANGIVIHYFASEAGSMLGVSSTQPSDTLSSGNSNVTGSFVSSQTNYVGVDFARIADITTTDTVQFLDSTTFLETPKTVPLARTLSYRIVISTTNFSANSNVCPVAKVVVDSSGNVVSITDARRQLFRLGSGSDNPNVLNAYAWPAGRSENTVAGSDIFSGGDKTIGNLKDWADAVMTRLWEMSGGGDYWYSPTSPQNVKLTREGLPLASGDYFSWNGTDLTWQGLKILFHNAATAGVYYNQITDQIVSSAGQTNLAVGDCIYVDLVRSSNATVIAVKGTLATLGAPLIPGSRYVLAYRGPNSVFSRDGYLPVGTTQNPATTTTVGAVMLSGTPPVALTPIAANLDVNNLAQASGMIRSASTPGGVGSLTFTGTMIDGASAVGTITDTSNALANATAKLHSFRNATVEKAAVSKDGSILSPALDALAAGVLNIGISTATSITISKTGVATTVAGSLVVSQGITSSTNGITISAGNLTLAGGSNTDSTGAINIGPTSATAVAVGHAGINTQVGGSFGVSQASLFSGSVTVAAAQTISMGANVVTNVGAPLVGTDAANKTYVDGKAQMIPLFFSIATGASTLPATNEYFFVATGASVVGVPGTTETSGASDYYLGGLPLTGTAKLVQFSARANVSVPVGTSYVVKLYKSGVLVATSGSWGAGAQAFSFANATAIASTDWLAATITLTGTPATLNVSATLVISYN